MDSVNLPVACSLTGPELQERRNSVLQKVRGAMSEIKETSGGYAYRFPSDEGWVSELARLIELERQCCPFLRFQVTVEAGGGPIWLELSGPEGTKAFLEEIFR